MAKVTIYTRPMCGYCARALGLLKEKGVDFEEIDAGYDPIARKTMREKSGGRNTFPQVFVGETHVGGCDELMALERDGKLDPMLNNG